MWHILLITCIMWNILLHWNDLSEFHVMYMLWFMYSFIEKKILDGRLPCLLLGFGTVWLNVWCYSSQSIHACRACRVTLHSLSVYLPYWQIYRWKQWSWILAQVGELIGSAQQCQVFWFVLPARSSFIEDLTNNCESDRWLTVQSISYCVNSPFETAYKEQM